MAIIQTAARALALSIVRELSARGKRALLVGGCVRDQVMGLEPKDYDVATDARPDEVRGAFPRSVPVGAAFGVILVFAPDRPEVKVEVATFRSDGEYRDGRRPESVVFSGEREDAQRRDFTINGLFLDPSLDPPDGRVIDYVGGMDDIRARRIRAIGDPRARFTEDKLRLFRALRFACRFNFEIDAPTWEALLALAPDTAQISNERIRDELDRMVLGPGRGRALRLLHESGLLRRALPDLAAVFDDGAEGIQCFARTGAVLDLLNAESATLALAWAALVEGAATGNEGRFNPRDALTRLCQPNALIGAVSSILSARKKIDGAPALRLADLKRLLREPHFREALELDRLRRVASGDSLDANRFCTRKLAEFTPAPGGRDPLNPPPPIDGDDLRALGLRPGPRFREILDAVETEVLEGRVTGRDEALAFARKIAGRNDG